MVNQVSRNVSVRLDRETAAKLVTLLRGGLNGVGQVADACNNINASARKALADACNNIDATGLKALADACNNINSPGLKSLADACNNISAANVKSVAHACNNVDVRQLTAAVAPDFHQAGDRIDAATSGEFGANEIRAVRQRLSEQKLTAEDVKFLNHLAYQAEDAAEGESFAGRRLVAHLPFGMDLVK